MTSDNRIDTVDGTRFVSKARHDRSAHQRQHVGKDAGSPSRTRIGFMAGEVEVPEDFDTMGADAIEKMFEGNS